MIFKIDLLNQQNESSAVRQFLKVSLVDPLCGFVRF